MDGVDFPAVSDIDVHGKRVLVRVGMDVSVDKEGNILDDKRIRVCVPTIEYLRDKGAKVILLLHIGRPKGQAVDCLKCDKVADRLSELTGKKIRKIDSIVGEDVRERIRKMRNGDAIFLENVRFHPGEEGNDDSFSRELASLADIYINECFSVSHRKHASMVGVPKYLPSYGGFVLKKELDVLRKTMKNPERPFVAILGGKKADKMNALKKLAGKADKVLVGGNIAMLLLKMRGNEVGDAKFSDEWLTEEAKKDLTELAKSGKIVLPIDMIVSNKGMEQGAEVKAAPANAIAAGWTAFDIGPETIKLFRTELEKARTVVWAGPLGVFEDERFSRGTKEIGEFLAEKKIMSIIGGGETATAAEKFGLDEKFYHVSTGGGAFMTFITEESLPAVEALETNFRIQQGLLFTNGVSRYEKKNVKISSEAFSGKTYAGFLNIEI